MGRSFAPIDGVKIVEDFERRNSYFHEPSQSHFTMVKRDGAYYQKRHQLDGSGKVTNEMEMRVDFVMGSGNHARTYLHRMENGKLLELPLGWYAEKGGYWAMNPGYDRRDHQGFRREITYDCMFCHNAYPKIPAQHEEPVYVGELPQGIDCQRCHGDGVQHMKLAGAGAAKAAVRQAIVKPGMDTCLACHLETTSFSLPNAIQRYERGPFSYRAGEPLENFILNFDHAKGHEDKFELVNAGYRMRQSTCFLKSKMTCTTCHNPHRTNTIEEHNATCKSCHSSGDHATARTDCVSCHMPKRRSEDVIHAVVTDHKIARHKPKGDLLAELTETHAAYRGPVVPYYPAKLTDELYLAVAQVKQGSNLKAGIPQLTAAIAKYKPLRGEWYLELAEAHEREKHHAAALPWFREAVRRMPQSAYAMQRLGTSLRWNGKLVEAAATLLKAPTRAASWHELGLVYQQQGKTTEAIEAFRKAVQMEPQRFEAWNNLGILRMAESDFREAIRIHPAYADAHANLAQYLAGQGRGVEARVEFLAAIELQPNDAQVRFNHAMLEGRLGDYAAARRELERAVEIDAKFVEARETLGDVLMGMNEAQAAIGHYRAVQPPTARALYGLGAALAATGQRDEARAVLDRAAQDPAWRERVEALKRSLRF